MTSITWKHLPLELKNIPPSSLLRSSHSLAILDGIAYLFGGENKPRTPVDDELYKIDLSTGSVTISSSTLKPSPRVGTALVAHQASKKLYLWGGREGKDMSPCNSDLWIYDILSDQWERRETSQARLKEGEEVAHRSYHVMAIAGDDIYLHAGCPAKGRVATLHSISPTSTFFKSLSSAPGPGRGGTVLTPLTLPSGKIVLARFGGFAGYELGGQLDLFDPSTNTWDSVVIPSVSEGGPDARSVHGLIALPTPKAISDGKTLLAVMIFGEREPTPGEVGHNGAGTFHSDAWGLSLDTSSEKWSFTKIDQIPETEGGETPTARGWFASGQSEGEIIVFGGLNEKNERLGDLWIGSVAV